MKLFILVLLLVTTTAWAEVAKVVAIRGTVIANDIELSQGDSLAVGDKILAAEKSFAVFQFVDGAKVTLRPQSEMIIEEYSYMEGIDGGKLNLLSGGLRIVTGAIAKSNPENYYLNTPTALMGVRGTEFSVYLIQE